MKADNSGYDGSYYNLPAGASELQDLIEHRNLNFALGNIFKAVWRMGATEQHKRTAEYDLQKIIFYAERELRRIK
jgi:hypothetical protein